jgi:hypothetical protein
MRLKARFLFVLTLLAALLACQTAVAASVPRQTKLQAERNLLRATRLLARWDVGLVSPRSGLLLRNTTATCTGEGVPFSGRYARFTCVLRHGSTRVRVAYFAQPGGGFAVRRLPLP